VTNLRSVPQKRDFRDREGQERVACGIRARSARFPCWLGYPRSVFVSVLLCDESLRSDAAPRLDISETTGHCPASDKLPTCSLTYGAEKERGGPAAGSGSFKQTAMDLRPDALLCQLSTSVTIGAR
jgi:hypothetical protein